MFPGTQSFESYFGYQREPILTSGVAVNHDLRNRGDRSQAGKIHLVNGMAVPLFVEQRKTMERVEAWWTNAFRSRLDRKTMEGMLIYWPLGIVTCRTSCRDAQSTRNRCMYILADGAKASAT